MPRRTGRRVLPIAAALAWALAAASPTAQAQPAPPAAAPPGAARPVAVLQALDKVTGRVRTLDIAAGDTAEFRELAITVRTCARRPPEEPPESTAFVEIRLRRPNEEPRLLYSGWMYASSPTVAGLDHPVYDVWITACRPSAPAPTPAPPAAPRAR
ncbi:MAG: DUF2155 domain-containing protein [Alphaproteobacteria bacterium]|nr:DUF2155 domain-containing protein [Alphaproteobacteria bacterium]